MNFDYKEWQSLEDAKSDPDRIITIRKADLDTLVDLLVCLRMNENQGQKTVILPPEAKVLGPSKSQNWINGSAIKRARVKMGLTQKQLAFMVGLKFQAQLSDIELTGRVPFGYPDIAEKFADALGIEADAIKTRYQREGN